MKTRAIYQDDDMRSVVAHARWNAHLECRTAVIRLLCSKGMSEAALEVAAMSVDQWLTDDEVSA